MTISVTHATPSGGEVNQDDYEAEHVVSGAADATHSHSGADITSGTVADARIASTLTRDSEAAAAYAALVHAHAGTDITSGTVAAARLPTLDAITAPVADVSMNTHKITGVVDPTSNQHAATKKYVDDSVAAGVSFGSTATDLGVSSGGDAASASRSNHVHAAASLTNQLSGDVTMTNANTYYDGPSISLPAGTWMLMGFVQLNHAASQDRFTAKIWDGTTVVASSGQTMPGNGFEMSLGVAGLVTIMTTTTYKISVASNGAGAKILAAAPTNGAGNNASTLVAVKIG